MGKESKIEWTDSTWNPWIGCSKISAGCTNCYMFREQERYGNDPTVIHMTKPRTFLSPLRWKEPRKIFVCSWSDFFHPEVPSGWRERALKVMYQCPQHTFLVLTKRPENINKFVANTWWESCTNIWLGVTAENQETADERIPLLLEIPASKKFISCEPLLGPIDFERELGKWFNGIGWIIVGGESGNHWRPMKNTWVRSIRDQCYDYGVPFFMKQMAGRTKAERADIPKEFFIREFPDASL